MIQGHLLMARIDLQIIVLIGGIPHEQIKKSMRLFAKEVMAVLKSH